LISPHHLKRNAIIWAQTPGEQLNLLRLGVDPPSGANLTILNDRDLTEIQVHIQRDRPPDYRHPVLLDTLGAP
jgi:hypothetical protein